MSYSYWFDQHNSHYHVTFASGIDAPDLLWPHRAYGKVGAYALEPVYVGQGIDRAELRALCLAPNLQGIELRSVGAGSLNLKGVLPPWSAGVESSYAAVAAEVRGAMLGPNPPEHLHGQFPEWNEGTGTIVQADIRFIYLPEVVALREGGFGPHVFIDVLGPLGELRPLENGYGHGPPH
jgi:hypothetical protein